jgi:hypothetical protein
MAEALFVTLEFAPDRSYFSKYISGNAYIVYFEYAQFWCMTIADSCKTKYRFFQLQPTAAAFTKKHFSAAIDCVHKQIQAVLSERCNECACTYL